MLHTPRAFSRECAPTWKSRISECLGKESAYKLKASGWGHNTEEVAVVGPGPSLSALTCKKPKRLPGLRYMMSPGFTTGYSEAGPALATSPPDSLYGRQTFARERMLPLLFLILLSCLFLFVIVLFLFLLILLSLTLFHFLL